MRPAAEFARSGDLRQRRRHGRLGAAVAVSTLVHALLFYILPWAFDPTARPAGPEPAPLVVSIGSPGTSTDELAPSDGLRTPEAPLPVADAESETPAPVPEPAPDMSEASAGESRPEAAEAESRSGVPAPDRFEAREDTAAVAAAAMPGIADQLAIVDLQPELPLPTPVIEARNSPLPQAPYSVRQQKMLARKVENWAETFQRKHEPGEEITWKHDGQRYTARFTSTPGGDDSSLDRLSVHIATEQNGDRLTTTVELKRLAFSNFAQFVHRWDQNVQIHDDQLDGRFHSNSAINLSYSRQTGPLFLGRVTTSARTINVTERRGYRRRADIFQGGLETGVRTIRLPRDYVPLPANLEIDESQRHEFTEDTRITFHADGSYSYVSTESGLFERRGTIERPATYLIANDKAELTVRGTVRGRVLVYSPTRVVISGDLRYANDPERSESTDDFIGIVSARSVEIAEPEVTGPGDLTIQAAIYAEKRFQVRKYRRRGKGTLEIYGSLTAGSLSATEPRYATRIRFDPRLESRRPPGFPVTDRYETESWDEVWTVEDVGTR